MIFDVLRCSCCDGIVDEKKKIIQADVSVDDGSAIPSTTVDDASEIPSKQPIHDGLKGASSPATNAVVVIQTPSPKQSTLNARLALQGALEADCKERASSAAKDTAYMQIASKKQKKVIESLFSCCSSSTKLNEKTVKKLRTIFAKDPSLVRARSFGLGWCPDSLTPLMACAVSGQIVAAKIILEVAESFKQAFPEMEYLHLDRNIYGRPAISLAAEAGNLDMLDLLLVLQKLPEEGEAATELNSPPIDLLGRTPFGCGITSPTPKARSKQKELEEKLFSPIDSSIRGAYHPAKDRMCTYSSLQLTYGTADMPGVRIAMEDALCQQSWQESLCIGDDTHSFEYLLLGVCDGHGDDGLVSNFTASNIAKNLRETMMEKSDEVVEVDLTSSEYWNAVWSKTCVMFDAELKREKLDGGSTGVFALFSDEIIVVANVGDSRCILLQEASTDSLASTVTPLSFDHKPENPVEVERCTKAGMQVQSKTYVIDGVERKFTHIVKSESDKLAVSRAFGDFDYKGNDQFGPEGQAVCCIPDVVVHQRDKKDNFLVLACDGVWDVMSNEDVKDFVLEQVKIKKDTGVADAILPDVGDALLEACLLRGSRDNMSAIIVSLKPRAGQALYSIDELPAPTALDFGESPSK
jgi:protein phosphatase PTC2/3